MAFANRLKKKGSGNRDLGLSHGAGKGSAPRNMGPDFYARFPESLKGDGTGYVRHGQTLVKTFK